MPLRSINTLHATFAKVSSRLNLVYSLRAPPAKSEGHLSNGGPSGLPSSPPPPQRSNPVQSFAPHPVAMALSRSRGSRSVLCLGDGLPVLRGGPTNPDPRAH